MQMEMGQGMLVIVMVENPREQQDGFFVLIVSHWILAVPSVMEDVCFILLLRHVVCTAYVHQIPMYNII